MDKYIIIGEYKDKDNSKTIYVSNTLPICWVEQEDLAKKYDYVLDAIHDIEYEYPTYKKTILGTYLSYISVLFTESRKIVPIIDNNGDLLTFDE